MANGVSGSPNPKQLRKAWVVTLSAALYFFYEFMQAAVFNAINTPLSHAFHLTPQAISDISSAFFYAEILFLLPAGVLLDYCSTRRLILLAMLISVLCTAWFALTNHVWILSLMRFITGIAGAFTMLACIRIASRWFPANKMALVVGMITFMPMLGAMLAQTPMVYLIKLVGWRMALIYDALFGLLLWLVVYWQVQDFPSQAKEEAKRESGTLASLGLFAALKAVLRNRQNWLAGLYASCMNLPIFVLGAIWGQRYLVQVYGMKTIQASWANTLLFFGMMLGCPIVGRISDRLKNRKSPMWITGLCILVTELIVFYVPHLPFSIILSCFFLIGLFSAGQIITYPLIAESNDLALTGAAEGVAATLIMAGGLSQVLVGHLLGQHGMLHFGVGFALMPVAIIVGLGCLLGLRETGARAFSYAMMKKG